MLHTRGGMRKADVDYAAALADAGFVSLAVSYYPSPRHDADNLHHPGYVEELLKAVDWLRSRPEVKGQAVGVVGFSLGSKAVTLSAHHPAIKAVVSYYGVYNLRILPRAMGRKTYPMMPVDVAAEVRAPVLLLHGTEDDETPLDQAESMHDALVKAGKAVELVVYPGATHSFDRGHPAGGCGRTTRGFYYCLDPKARDDAWNRTLSWFRKYLTSAP
ncbi:MAG: dienelactone hydrolase family protein [Deltaproteobacteria bacterium]|nr:dienelactone hydrolase family protein [Deltaproteobacteria bacterium]